MYEALPRATTVSKPVSPLVRGIGDLREIGPCGVGVHAYARGNKAPWHARSCTYEGTDVLDWHVAPDTPSMRLATALRFQATVRPA